MELKTYRFCTSELRGRGFKLAVLAVSLASARRYVRAGGTAAHRALKFVGEGAPGNPEGWCGARARCFLLGKEY